MARHCLVALLLLLPLGAAHPIHYGNGVTLDVHFVDATDGTVHHFLDHQTQYGTVNPGANPLLVNRSYWVVVEMRKDGDLVDGTIGLRANGTERYLTTSGGRASFPLGHPPSGYFFIQVKALPPGWAASTWERFDFAALPSGGPREPEPLDRWGQASLPEWRTYEWTAEKDGFGKFSISWGDVGSGPGGYLALLHYLLPNGAAGFYYVWTAFEGPYAARAHVAHGAVEAGHTVDAPVFLSGGSGIAVAGDWPAGAVVTATQGVLRPNDAGRFQVIAEADAGVFGMQQTAAGAMRAIGAPAFAGGTQVTATTFGFGESIRDGREANFALDDPGTVLLAAYVADSTGIYAWRFAGEEETVKFTRGGWFWTMTGGCDGPWWLHVEAARFGDESFVLLHLANHTFPASIDALLTKPVGTSTCRRL